MARPFVPAATDRPLTDVGAAMDMQGLDADNCQVCATLRVFVAYGLLFDCMSHAPYGCMLMWIRCNAQMQPPGKWAGNKAAWTMSSIAGGMPPARASIDMRRNRIAYVPAADGHTHECPLACIFRHSFSCLNGCQWTLIPACGCAHRAGAAAGQV
jgi:hypothetical protein